MSVRIEHAVNPVFQPADVAPGITVGGFTTIAEVDADAPIRIGPFCAFKRCRLGRFFACGNACSAADVTFGSFVSIGERVAFNAGRHPKERLTTHLFPYNRTEWGELSTHPSEPYQWTVHQTIGCDVWVGTNAVLLTGISVGHGAIIGANTVVNADVPPYAICVGSPGRIVGYRFEPDVIQHLLRLSWWDLPLADIEGLPFSDIDRCLAILEATKRA